MRRRPSAVPDYSKHPAVRGNPALEAWADQRAASEREWRARRRQIGAALAVAAVQLALVVIALIVGVR